MVGGPLRGFFLYGPFKSEEEANAGGPLVGLLLGMPPAS
jgi:hypothetical protein